jgi:RNA polymerase sigma factor (sigma-70 family)
VTAEHLERVFPQIVAKWRAIAGKRGFPEGIVDDAISAATERLFCNYQRIGDATKLVAYANTTFLNCARDLCPRGPGNASFDGDIVEMLPARGLDPEQRQLEAERLRLVREAIAELTARQKEVLRLYLAGLQGPDIAAAVGRSHDRVRNILTEVRDILGAHVAARFAGGPPRDENAEKP